MKVPPRDPMRTRATDSGLEDGWLGVRIGAESRMRARRAATRIGAAVDIGEPGPPRVTIAFLAVTVLATIAQFSAFGASPDVSELSRAGGAGIGVVATGAWWKLLVSNILHGGIVHLLMNVFVIYLMGRWLEHLVGRIIVVATIAWAALLSGVGSLIVDTPSVSIGASGVAFALVGCAVAVDPRARTATGVIARQLAIVNVIITFVVPGISIGGHLFGLLGGLLVGWIAWDRTPGDGYPAGRLRRARPALLIAVSLPLVVLYAVGPSMLPNEAAGVRGATTAWLLQRQLSGSTLSSGRDIDDAACEPTDDLLVFDCRLDGRTNVVVTFRERDDQWSMRGA
jgi:membrane associated rhomboid family serine protease